jgi:hypothetical protein
LKACRSCKLHKQVEDYHISATTKTGYTTKCRACLLKASLVFEIKAKGVHGAQYDYNLQEDYKGDRTVVQIRCKNHDHIFLQRPFAHIRGQGCPVCGQESRVVTTTKTTEAFLVGAVAVHGNSYCYNDTEYSGAFTKVSISCPKKDHGIFRVIANNHLGGHGCPVCAKGKTILGVDKFIEDSKEYYGLSAFDYTKVVYVNNTTKVDIKCTLHDAWFSVTPMFHRDPMKNSGCKHCGKLSSNRWTIKAILNIPNIENKTGYIYIVQVNALPLDYFKIGITADLISRQSCYKRDLGDVGTFSYNDYSNYNYLRCARLEALLKVFLRPYHTKAIIDFGGKTEVFCLPPQMLNFITDIIKGLYDKLLDPHLTLIISNKIDATFLSQIYDEVKTKYE